MATLSTPCKVWSGAVSKQGNGILTGKFQGSRLAHRKSLAEFLGRPILPGLFALHHCDNPPCYEPTHLYEGTQKKNMEDMSERGRAKGQFSDVSECIHGHAFVEENTAWYERTDGYLERRCKECRRRRSSEQAARRKAARQAKRLV